MPDLVIVRLHPASPTSGEEFQAQLQDLSIAAHDLSFADSAGGTPVGRASGLAAPHLTSTANNAVDIRKTSILQHYVDVDVVVDGASKARKRRLEAVATAVIVVKPPKGHVEYPTANAYDIRLEVTRAGRSVLTRASHFNVAVVGTDALSSSQKAYFGMPAAAYVALPPSNAGLDPALAYVDLPPEGGPPAFDALCEAIDRVLARDPGGAGADLLHLAPLTAAQSRQVAAEIAWNRTASPPPEPPPELGEDAFGALYTRPAVDPAVVVDEADLARLTFEAARQGYVGSRDAEASRLAGFVFSAAAAVAQERMSAAADRARMDFPVIAGAATPKTESRASVALTRSGGLIPQFIVPAAYFYALAAALPPELGVQERYEMARLGAMPRLLIAFSAAGNAGSVTLPARAFTAPEDPPVNPDQAGRRLQALGVAPASLITVAPAPPLRALVKDWLGHPGPSPTIDADFWAAQAKARPAAYLKLVLDVVTEAHRPLVDAIQGRPRKVSTIDEFVRISDRQWRELFLAPSPPDGPRPRVDLLPPFTEPGTPEERTEAFIRHLRRFFVVPTTPRAATRAAVDAPPTLAVPIADAWAALMTAYATHAGAPLVLGTTPDEAALRAAVLDVFPGDTDAQAWLAEAVGTASALVELTDGVGAAERRFSLMEALYARGFTSPRQVSALSPADFAYALTGTVAYPLAAEIQARAGGGTSDPRPSDGAFRSVNPDGSLSDCVPARHLSPLGPVEYLRELLDVSPGSTCADPLRPADPNRLGLALEGRRGPLGALHATRANLETPLPVVDLVNESLEALTAGLAPGATGGAVRDTAGDRLAGHRLAGGYDLDADAEPFAHEPQTLFATMPEHSSPATPVDKPAAYDLLRSDFTAPDLPYPQALDICRSYLAAMSSDRFSTMRRFRKEISEFAIDAPNEPADFRRHLWRYPVRLDTALEYLRISPEEQELLYTHDIVEVATPGRLLLHELYGYPAGVVRGRPWTEHVVRVPHFLQRTGLSYCELLELWRSGFVVFDRAGEHPAFPDCEPCCVDDLVIDFEQPGDPAVALRRLAVFIRLWRRLQTLPEPKVTFAQLRDIHDVLGLFRGGAINPEFTRQLAALLMLRDLFCLPMADPGDEDPAATGADRTHLLALWVGPGARKWKWALDALLGQLQDMSESLERGRRGPQFFKLLAQNLDPLSALAGFDPATPSDTWHAQPTNTLRFAEVAWKLTASEFTIGEVLFLFTVDAHLDGDDPFPLQPLNESFDDPLQLPDDQHDLGLWALRGRLLEVDPGDEEAAAWTWRRIVTSLHDEFGLPAGAAGGDLLTALGEHFFPSVLERDGHPVPAVPTQYRVDLAAADTTPAMWNSPPDGPFRYDLGAEQLWTRLPLRDGEVAEKLSEIRPLSSTEQRAVQDLYFAPRAALAPFSPIFENFALAADQLVHGGDEDERFRALQAEFARFHARCGAIADHLAVHVARITGRDHPDAAAVAWRVLRSLWADGNRALTPWEDDSGEPPPVLWQPQPAGGAFAALLGLVGTGLLGEFGVEARNPIWRELRGPLNAFGPARDHFNAPVPTVIPSMGLGLTPDQQRYAFVRNGFAVRNLDGEPLFGAQPFSVGWRGALLVDHAGEYLFEAGAPTPRGEPPDAAAAGHHRWLMTLRRGQKRWFMLNRDWPDEEAPDARSEPLHLRRGVYEIEVWLQQPEPDFDREEDVCPTHTGFEVKYAGPDSDGVRVALPFDRLFRVSADVGLDAGIDTGEAAGAFLRGWYGSSLRDIRRTYQRAFKAVLFARGFGLTASPLPGDPQSELGFFLDHPEAFEGRTHYRVGAAAFATHDAWLDFNLLPVADPYHPRPPAQDERVRPSPRRQAALFDAWERMFDYETLRRESSEARERPAWRLFHEATERQPDDPAELLRHLGVDIRHAPLVLTYYDAPSRYDIATGDLETEAWAMRAWQGETWLRALERRFFPRWIGDADPAGWAADDPGAGAGSGNANLTAFFQDGSFENGDPRRYKDVRRLDDALRERARGGLLAYLCGMDRVGLPFAPGRVAREPRDLSDLLLQDVEAGICERVSRIEDAVSAVHAFVQRARLGLEPGFTASAAFVAAWDGRFAGFHAWECCRRREVYRENWVDYDELEEAGRIEAFQVLQQELRNAKLTVAVPGGSTWWPDQRPPAHSCLTLLQANEPAQIRLLEPPRPQNLELLGAPERDARPSWLAQRPSPESGSDQIPLWIEAAVGLGVRFVRVAAAGLAPAASAFAGQDVPGMDGCCEQCGDRNEPLVDELYFWLLDARRFDALVQDADVGAVAPEGISHWHRPEQLPTLLHWPSEPTVHLVWSRVHNGGFQPPRRSDEGLSIDASLLAPGELPQLDFMGRTGDSLRFEVNAGEAPAGSGDPTAPGFRYDLATDAAVVLPLVAAPPPLSPDRYPGGLDAYPYFTYFRPGGPVKPLSPFSVALTVAGVLRAHCQFEAALKWYEIVLDPLQRDNAWAARCPGLGVGEAVSRDRAILLHHLETMLEWGDALLCRNTPEALRQAGVIFDTAQRVLGGRPMTIHAEEPAGPAPTVSALVAQPAPLNPRLTAIYDSTADRRELIHECLNVHRLRSGRPNLDMPYFGDDPKGLGGQCDVCGCCDCDGSCRSCCDAYRFAFRLQKALELAGEVRALGAALLGAYERGDAEHLASLRATHERQLLHLALEARQNQWRDADWQVQALQKTKEGSQTRLRYYQALIAGALNGGEIAYDVLTGVSTGSRTTGNVSEGIAQGVGMAPDFWFGAAGFAGSPLEFSQMPMGSKLAGGFATAARIMNALAEIASSSAAQELTHAGWARREAEWLHQTEVIEIEIDQIERQILGAERRRDVALRELSTHQRQIEHSIEVQDFLRDRFTGHELYLFLQRETSALYRQAYELALAAARLAERAFNFERGHTTRRFLPETAWDSLREGLLAGERLQLAVRQMEHAYLDANCREYELTKHISLRLGFPLAFLRLQTTGCCELEIPEWLLDLDYPGHYMRRIRSVTLTIPCVTGPYTGVHCRLTLLSSTTRIDAGLGEAPVECCHESCACGSADPCCCCDPEASRYALQPGDARAVRVYAATEAIATSSGRNDAGMFELSFSDERYLPFEFAGAVSRWRIELPPETNAFDFGSLSDVVMHLNYTALEGGDVLAAAAVEDARCRLPGDGLRLVDVRRDLPDAWYELQLPPDGRVPARSLPLHLGAAMFPFVPGRRVRWIDSLQVFFQAPGAEPAANHVIRFLVGSHEHDYGDACGCGRDDVHCIAAGEWPTLFWGVVDLSGRRLGPLDADAATALGTLEFPSELGEICEVHLVVRYCAEPWPPCGEPPGSCGPAAGTRYGELR